MGTSSSGQINISFACTNPCTTTTQVGLTSPSMFIVLYLSLLPCALIYCLFCIAGEWVRPNLHTDLCCKARICDTAYSGVSRMFQTPRLLLGYISTAPFAFTNWVSEQSIALRAVCVHSFLQSTLI